MVSVLEDAAKGNPKRARRAASTRVILKDLSEDEVDAEEKFVEAKPAVRKKSAKKTKKMKNDNAVSDSEDNRIKLLIDRPELSCPPQGMVISFDKFWPYALNVDEPVDKNLILFEVASGCGKESCSICSKSQHHYVDLEPKIGLEYHDPYRAGIRLTALTDLENLEEDSQEFTIKIEKTLKCLDYYTEVIPEDQMKREDCFCPSIDFTDLNTRELPEIKLSQQFILLPGNYLSPEGACCPAFCFELRKHANLMRAVCYQSKFYIYLKADHISLQESLSKMKSGAFFEALQNHFLQGNLSKGYLEVEAKSAATILDSPSFPEFSKPKNLSFDLSPFQLGSLRWMMKLEQASVKSDQSCLFNNFDEECSLGKVKIKIGETGWYFDLFGYASTRNPATSSHDPISIRGGVLVDENHARLIQTSLALVHSAPFSENYASMRDLTIDRCLPYNVPSQATCVLCNLQSISEWKAEVSRFNNGLKLVEITCWRDYQNCSWRDFVFADLIIISLDFLAAAKSSVLSNPSSARLDDIVERLDKRGQLLLSKICFHRLIFDGVHDIISYEKVALKADFRWILSQTIDFSKKNNISQFFSYLNISPPDNNEIYEEFLAKFVRRPLSDFEFPQIVQELIWVTPTADELALMRTFSPCSTKAQQMMMCSHYQISQSLTKIVGTTILPIGDVISEVEKAFFAEMTAKKAALNLSVETMASSKNEAQSGNNYISLTADVERETDLYNHAVRKYELFVESCRNASSDDCDGKLKELDHTALYRGSKLNALIEYLSKLQCSDPDARVIIFLQQSILSDLLSSILKESSIKHVQITGSTHELQVASNQFITSAEYRLAILKPEDIFKGLNLSRASHLILLHPLITEQAENDDFDFELQAIRCAFQNRLDALKIVRFAVKGSIEEELALNRHAKLDFITSKKNLN